jgi:hypothetical protein
LRKNEQALIRTLRKRLATFGNNEVGIELLLGVTLALEASGWSKAAIYRALLAVTNHRFGDGVGVTVADGVRTLANDVMGS